jgi:hypothetical protein
LTETADLTPATGIASIELDPDRVIGGCTFGRIGVALRLQLTELVVGVRLIVRHLRGERA